jgi:hypothetical protein
MSKNPAYASLEQAILSAQEAEDFPTYHDQDIGIYYMPEEYEFEGELVF